MQINWGKIRNVVVLDTESYIDTTTGQRRLLALAFQILDVQTRRSHSHSYNIVNPGVYHPDTRSTRVHGISPELVAAQGVNVTTVLSGLSDVLRRDDIDALAAHDTDADVSLLITEAVQAQNTSLVDSLIRVCHICTKVESTAICAIPFHGPCAPLQAAWKWPSLAESYKTLVGEDLVRGVHHDCQGDTNACSRVLLRLCEIHT